MKYIFHKRFKGKSISGMMNIPAKTKCESVNGLVFVLGLPVFFETSENAHTHVATDEDGFGLQRGALTKEICSRIKKAGGGSVAKKMRGNIICEKYCRGDCKGVWLWNHDFYNASIEDLQYILHLIR